MRIFANLVAISFVIHFCWSYYWNCYRKGYTLDVWHSSLLFNVFIIHVMLPFSRSNLNVISIPYQLKRTQAHVDEAYLISALGYAALLVGGSLWRVELGLGIRRAFDRFVELPARASFFLLNSRPLLLLSGAFGLIMMAGVLLTYFATAGFGFNLRALLLVSPRLRPFAQFSAFYCVMIASYCFDRFFQLREKLMLVISLLMVCGFVFYGERGNIFAIPVGAIYVSLIRFGRRIRLYWVCAGAAGTMLLVFVLDALREPNFSMSTVVGRLLFNIFFGNSFSDTRDFALVLSYWPGHFYYGLTYLAGVISFVPRFLSSFRDTWALGVVTATMAGLSPKEHPGLRVGLFGESYLNFGLLGVVVLGLLTGAVTRLIDSRMKQAARMLSTLR